MGDWLTRTAVYVIGFVFFVQVDPITGNLWSELALGFVYGYGLGSISQDIRRFNDRKQP